MHNAKKTLYWIRHAKPEYPGSRRMCLGQKVDVPLSMEGLRQAERLAAALACIDFECVYFSPLLRARQTAECITAGRIPLQRLEALMELDGGEWDGLTFDEIHRRYPAFFVPGAEVPPPPGAESDEQGLKRALAALSEIDRQTTRCAAVVSHSGLNRVLLAALMGKPLRLKKQIHQDYACISILRCEAGIWRVEKAGITLEEWENR